MELTKIKGNTYYIDAPTNIGVYSFKNKNCLLIDTGLNNSAARKIEEVVNQNGLHPKYIINTHTHLDHTGGNNYFKTNYPGCQVYASEEQKLFMENPELMGRILFSATPIKDVRGGNKAIERDFTVEMGINKINDEKFEIISLNGHSTDHIGIITPEKVCFLGDSIFSLEIMKKYSLPYLVNIDDTIDTLNKIKEIDADFFLISHIDRVLNRDEIIKLADDNLSNLESYKEQIITLLDGPLTREDILENLIVLNDLEAGYKQYHLYLSTVSAFISHLYDNDLISYSIENGKLYYFRAK